ncbi:MAG: hypothetical protein HY815_32895 [Candidatus Riflebacteria bacterium]|nr:hypothetical protein [Candidatus Riflebacteria bacterium]
MRALWALWLGLAILAPDVFGSGDSQLQAVLAVRVRDGVREVPAKLLAEVTSHLQRAVKDLTVVTTTPTRGAPRFVMVVSFPAEERLKFEKMVVELPTAAFSNAVNVESWNINYRPDSAGATDETTQVPFVNFKLDLDSRGTIVAARLKDVSLKDILGYLARTARIQYVCPLELAERTLSAELRNLTVDEFFRALRLALSIDIDKQGAVYVVSQGHRARPKKPASEE